MSVKYPTCPACGEKAVYFMVQNYREECIKCGAGEHNNWTRNEADIKEVQSKNSTLRPESVPSTWDTRFLQMAKLIASWSKDPSTKVGAVIVRPDRTIASLGFNGFPRAIHDYPELLSNRDEKYKRIIHSELNAILSARERLDGYTLYLWPGMSCARCAVHIIQTGIVHVVTQHDMGDFGARWAEEIRLAEDLFREAKVTVSYVDFDNN